jgi:hypothetical protein
MNIQNSMPFLRAFVVKYPSAVRILNLTFFFASGVVKQPFEQQRNQEKTGRWK